MCTTRARNQDRATSRGVLIDVDPLPAGRPKRTQAPTAMARWVLVVPEAGPPTGGTSHWRIVSGPALRRRDLNP